MRIEPGEFEPMLFLMHEETVSLSAKAELLSDPPEPHEDSLIPGTAAAEALEISRRGLGSVGEEWDCDMVLDANLLRPKTWAEGSASQPVAHSAEQANRWAKSVARGANQTNSREE